MATNVLVMVHGMTTATQAGNHAADYNALWNGLIHQAPTLRDAFAGTIRVEWGHRPLGVEDGALRPDQRLTDAENTIANRVSHATVAADKSPQNHTLGMAAEIFSKLVTRRITDPIKETAELFGVTDVLYYCAPDGETAVRYAVYSQVLEGLEPFRDAEEVRLHLVGHSLGVTVAFDFLFGLFAPDDALTEGVPGFLRATPESDPAHQRYAFWRQHAQADPKTLLLGSKVSTGGQLPLTVMRKQKLVDTLAQGALLDPTLIGLALDGGPKWRIFYDIDDILGFPTRRLFTLTPAIEEFQVDTNWRPDLSHGAYWTNGTVLKQAADLIQRNLG